MEVLENGNASAGPRRRILNQKGTGNSAMQLSQKTLAAVKPGVAIPAYDRQAVSVGIVHFGPGAFHRGHQACYIDTLLAKDPRWGLCEVELRPGGSADALTAQDCLYTVAELEVHPKFRIVGSIKEYLTVADGQEPIFARLINPDIKLVTMTVTEKGYCLGADGNLDRRHPDILHDLSDPKSPKSLIGWIVEGLRRRKAAGVAPFIAMSCDNVMGNGHKLKRAVLDYATALGDGAFAQWIGDNVKFPCTMVDSITPATTDEVVQKVVDGIGMQDGAPVQRERFQQWVIEDILGPEAPDFASVGAEVISDVEAYELAKLRLLNGAHSTLAYTGLLRGAASVEAAMADAPLGAYVEAMMREDIVPSLRPVAGFDTKTYISELLTRFRNPALTHLLYQIASDGSQKIPYRILAPIADNLAAGRPVGRLALPVAAWMRFVERDAKAGRPFNDPMTDALTAIGKSCTGKAHEDVQRFLALTSVFPAALAKNASFAAAVSAIYERLPHFP